MTNFVVIKKDSLNKVTVNAERITLSEASIVHTKMHRQDVAEFFRDGNNLVLKLVNGEIVVVENFFVTYDNVTSDLVFEEDGCVLYWFDGVSGFKGIPGLEALLPAASAAQLGGILPWLAGAAVVGGIAAIIADHDKDKKIPDGTVALKIGTDGKIIGTTKEIPTGTDVMVTVKGKDKDGNEVTKEIPTKVQPDGSFQVDVPAEIVDGSKIDATATTKDRNGQDRTGTDELAGSNETGSNGGLNREPSEIKVTIGTDGKLTGTTRDVAPGSKVIITVEGLDKDGNPVKADVETTVKSDGSYETQVPSEIVDGSPIDATAKTTDRNGKQITGTDELAGSNEPDSNGGLDRTPGAIDLVVTSDGKLTGITKDVKPGQEVTITVKGVDKNGNPVEEAIKTTVNPDGSYTAELPPTTKLADGSPLDAEAKTKDRNGNEISGKDDLGGTGTPDAGLNLVPGSIDLTIGTDGSLTGTTVDVKPGETVTITLKGMDKDGNVVTETVTTTVQPDGSYTTQLPPSSTIAEGSAIVGEATSTDRNGDPVKGTDAIGASGQPGTELPPTEIPPGVVVPPAQPGGGLDKVPGSIDLTIGTDGSLTGTTVDVKPGETVTITLKGMDKDGNVVTETVTTTVQPDGSYTTQLPPSSTIAEGSAIIGEATSTDRNGDPVKGTDAIGASGQPGTELPPTEIPPGVVVPPAQPGGGLDKVPGSIDLTIGTDGSLTGTTVDVKPGETVTITLKGMDKDGNVVTETVTTTVQPDGSYTTQLPPSSTIAEGSAIIGEATSTDRNGDPVKGTDAIGASGQPGTELPPTEIPPGVVVPPAQPGGGLDKVPGSIDLTIGTDGSLTGTTVDVKPGETVTITLKGMDKDGNVVTETVTTTVQPDGSYTTQLPPSSTIAEGSAIIGEATSTDRNGDPVKGTDAIGASGQPGTELPPTEIPPGVVVPPAQPGGGLDKVPGSIDLTIGTDGSLTGTTVDVKPGETVTITLKGMDKDGNVVTETVTTTVQPDGSYTTQLPPSSTIAEGSAIVGEATSTDRNGDPVKGTDAIGASGQPGTELPPTEIPPGVVVPPAQPGGGLDKVPGSIDLTIGTDGSLTGTTVDVKPGETVTITLKGMDKDGNVVTETVTTTVQPDGSYTTQLPPSSTIAEGSAIIGEATSTDRNGDPVKGTDAIGASGQPGTELPPTEIPPGVVVPPAQPGGGLDKVPGSIDLTIGTDGSLTGTTVDVKPGETVTITLKGMDKDGNVVTETVTTTVQPDGSYTTQLPPSSTIAEGSAIIGEATSTDRNGDPVKGTDAIGASGQPGTELPPTEIPPGVVVPPAQPGGGLDKVPGSIDLTIGTDGSLTGTTVDVKPGETVTITLKGMDKDGNVVTETVTTTVQPDGSYTTQLPPSSTIAEGSAIIGEATSTDRNGDPVKGTDAIGASGQPGTELPPTEIPPGVVVPPAQPGGGLDKVPGSIDLTIGTDGSLTGTTVDVKPGETVTITLKGMDKDGNVVTETVTTTVQPDGSYTTQLPPSSTIAEGSAIVGEATSTDRNGDPVKGTDAIGASGQPGTELPPTEIPPGVVVPPAQPGGGLDKVPGSIDLTIGTDGSLTGTTVDVKPGETVTITLKGMDKDGNVVTETVTTTVQPDGSYTTQLPPSSTIAEGSAIVGEATSTDRNGDPVKGTDAIGASGQPGTELPPTEIPPGVVVPPAQPGGGLDKVPGSIDLTIGTDGSLTGTTVDVKPGETVTITLKGMDKDGNVVTETVTTTVQPDGSYTTQLPPSSTIAEGSAIIGEATSTDRNGDPVKGTDAIGASGQPGTELPPTEIPPGVVVPPAQPGGGLDKVPGSIDLTIGTDGSLTGTTVDVKPGETVTITLKGMDKDGNVVTETVTTTVQPDGSYTTQLPPSSTIAEGSAIIGEATSTDRNGDPVKGTDAIGASGQPGTELPPTEIPPGVVVPPAQPGGGLDKVPGSIDLTIGTDGSLTGTTVDVKPGETVTITLKGMDKDGNVVTETVTTTVQPDGSYTTQLPPSSTIAEGSAIVGEATSTDRNGDPVKGTDAIGASGQPGTELPPTEIPPGVVVPPAQPGGGLDKVPGSIDLTIGTDGSLTGTTVDVKPGETVTITLKGMDKDGNVVTETVTTTVQPDGSYTTQLPPSSTIAEGSAIIGEATSTDRNGDPVKGTDAIGASGQPGTELPPTEIPPGVVVPPAQPGGGLDKVPGSIDLTIGTDGSLTGTTVDVKPGETVTITLKGMDKDGNVVTETVTTTVQPDGSYTTQLPPSSTIAEGSAIIGEATSTDRNGDPVKGTDAIGASGQPGTELPPTEIPPGVVVPPAQPGGGLDKVPGSIDLTIGTDGSLTGTTVDVKPGETVTITLKGMDKDGNVVTETVTTTVQPDGSYTTQLPPSSTIAEGSAIIGEATSTDRNGDPVKGTDAIGASGQPGTELPPTEIPPGVVVPPAQPGGGLDKVPGAITVQIDKDGNITGDTTDIKPGTNVHLVLTGLDKDGNPKTVTKDTTVDANGHYTDVLLPIDGIVDGTVNVVATSTDRNGTPVSDNDTINDLDIFHATINVDINEQGLITGTTEEVAPNTAVHLVISGIDEGGNPITVNKTVQTDANGHYQYQLVPTDGIVDSSAVDVVATTTDISNQPVGPATDSIEAAKDHDNDPETPDQGGLDLVPGAITVDINDSDSTKITGTTTDVASGSIVILHITGIDGIGEEIDFYQNVTTDANGHYSYTLTPQQGNALDVVATTSDRNGKPVTANDQFVDTPVVKADGDTNVTNGDNNVVGTSEDDVLAGDIGGLKTNFVAGQDYNVSVVLDLSGSMLWAMNGSSNPPAGESRLEIAKKGLKAFIAQMTGHDGTINLQIASFSASNGVGDGYNQTFMNVSASNVDAIFTYIDNLQAGGGTNPERGFNKAVNWFNGISTSGVENQTYYLTDGEPNSSQSTLDNAFAPLAAQSKVFAVGVSSSIQDSTVSRYDNTDVNGDKMVGTWNGNSNHGTAKAIADADKLIAYLIGGSENFQPADVGNDTVKGGAGGDVLFGDSINTDWITWSGRDSLQYPKYSGYSTLTAYLKAEVTSGAEPTQQQVYDYVKAHFRDFIAADANDPVTKGGHDTIYGGAGDDIIIAGAGNDKVYGGSGNDIISTGRGDDSIIYDVLKTADATAGNGTDTWVDYETNDKIEFGSNFFNGLLADKSNIADYISVEDDGQGNAVVKVDRDGTGTTHQASDLLIIENQAGLSLQDLLDHNQIVIG